MKANHTLNKETGCIRIIILNENFNKKEFQALWNQINHKYTYTVDFRFLPFKEGSLGQPYMAMQVLELAQLNYREHFERAGKENEAEE